MSATFKNRYRQLGIATAGALFCELALLLGAVFHILLGNPDAAVSNLLGFAGGVHVVSTVLLALYLVTSIAAAVMLWQQPAARTA